MQELVQQIRLFGIEVTFREVAEGIYPQNRPTDGLRLEVANPDELDGLVELAEGQLEDAIERRAVITDKCKQLLTFNAFLVAIIGFVLTKFAFFDMWLIRTIYCLAFVCLFLTTFLLLMFFRVAPDPVVTLEQNDVALDLNNRKKSLVNAHLRCQAETDNRTDYLVDVYKVARFYHLSALTIFAVMFVTAFMAQSPSDIVQTVLQSVRGDKDMTNLLRGPVGHGGPAGAKGDKGDSIKGDRGDKGDRGEKATIDKEEIVKELLSHPELKSILDEAKKADSKTTNP